MNIFIVKKNTTQRGKNHLHDTIKSGIIAGILGTVGDAFIHYPSYLLFGATTGHYISQLIFPFQTVTTIMWAIGELTHFFTGAVVGVMFSLVYKIFGSDYAYYKGLGMAAVFWIVHVAVIPNLVSPRPIIYRSVTESIVDLTALVMYGFSAATYLTRISRNKKIQLGGKNCER